MDVTHLELPQGFDSRSQWAVGQFMAQLDDQSRLLREAVNGYEADQLQWQPRPGVNTAGMLLAHMAVAECAWLNIIAADLPLEPDGELRIWEILGIRMNDDGLPLSPDGTHPVSLAGWTLDRYLDLLGRARVATYERVKPWQDEALHKTHTTRTRVVSRHWILYHVLEHFAAHFGQILMLKHMMRSEGAMSA